MDPTKSIVGIEEPRVTVLNTNYLDNLIEEPPKPKPKKKKKPTKAEIKARKLKAANEFKKLETRDRLRRELELSKKSVKRGIQDWEEMCREVKILELREELQHWSIKSQRMIAAKDEKIVMILDDMDQTLEMHKRNFSKHVQLMDYITDTYNTLSESTKLMYEYQASEVIQDFYEELNGKKERSDFIQNNCENIAHARNLILERELFSDHQIFLEKQDDRVNTEIEKRYKMRDKVVAGMKALRQQLLDFCQGLKTAELDPHKYERIRMLMERQRNFVSESQKLNDVEMKSTKLHGELQRDLLHMEVDAQRVINDLKLEQAYFLKVRKNIENEMNENRLYTYEKLRLLTKQSYAIVEKHKKLAKYGELLLSLSANCRKLQTEKEKVVSWADYQQTEQTNDTDFEEKQFELQILDLAKHIDLTPEQMAEQMNLLRNFWRRQSLVHMENLLLMEEKRQLEEENKKYCDFIRSMSKTDYADELLEAITFDDIKLNLPDTCPKKSKKCGLRLAITTSAHSLRSEL